MKVRAKHWLNLDGTWHRGGEVFDLPPAKAYMLKGSVVVLEEKPAPSAPLFEEPDEVPAEEKPKRRGGRPKKAAE